MGNGSAILGGVADRESSPSQQVALRELLVAVRQGLTEEELFLADQRLLGRDWAEIAAEKGDRPDALRMRLTRALDRVSQRLGLEDSDA